LLIDADMRNPSIHKIYNRQLGLGLSNVLTGNGQLIDYIQDSGTANLSILMAGPIPPNPAELLSADAIIRILAEATKRYDHVIVDGPPVLGLADAPLLSRAVEGTVLIIEAGRTPTTRARHAIERLFAIRSHIIGVVLTKFDLKTTGYGYGYGYGYEYHYGNKEAQQPALAQKVGRLLSRG
jgi:capsular exopolysaccharide synthesis family protein